MQGGTPSSARTGIVKTSLRIDNTLRRDQSAQEDLGTHRYLVIFYSPLQSAQYGKATVPYTSKKAGLTIMQFESAAD
jgi:hypothetical protein